MMLAVTLFALGALHAAEDKTFTVRVGTQPVELFDSRERHLVISQSCRRPDGKLGCAASEALSRATLRPRAGEPAGSGDKSPGARVCVRVGGRFVTALDEKGNELGLCRFKDGSLVSGGSLHYRARKNDARD